MEAGQGTRRVGGGTSREEGEGLTSCLREEAACLPAGAGEAAHTLPWVAGVRHQWAGGACRPEEAHPRTPAGGEEAGRSHLPGKAGAGPRTRPPAEEGAAARIHPREEGVRCWVGEACPLAVGGRRSPAAREAAAARRAAARTRPGEGAACCLGSSGFFTLSACLPRPLPSLFSSPSPLTSSSAAVRQESASPLSVPLSPPSRRSFSPYENSSPLFKNHALSLSDLRHPILRTRRFLKFWLLKQLFF